MFSALHVVNNNEWNILYMFISIWYLSYLNQFDKRVKSSQQVVLIILPKMCNVMDYITNYNFLIM